jgi:hypothetical protein
MADTSCSVPPCRQKAFVLVTDVHANNIHGYSPVCYPHMQQAITRGLRRARAERPGYRQPVLLIPLDSQS